MSSRVRFLDDCESHWKTSLPDRRDKVIFMQKSTEIEGILAHGAVLIEKSSRRRKQNFDQVFYWNACDQYDDLLTKHEYEHRKASSAMCWLLVSFGNVFVPLSLSPFPIDDVRDRSDRFWRRTSTRPSSRQTHQRQKWQRSRQSRTINSTLFWFSTTNWSVHNRCHCTETHRDIGNTNSSRSIDTHRDFHKWYFHTYRCTIHNRFHRSPVDIGKWRSMRCSFRYMSRCSLMTNRTAENPYRRGTATHQHVSDVQTRSSNWQISPEKPLGHWHWYPKEEFVFNEQVPPFSHGWLTSQISDETLQSAPKNPFVQE